MLGKLLDFEEMFAPKVLKLMYWLSMAAVILSSGLGILGGAVQMLSGGSYRFEQGIIVLISGAVTLVLGPIVVRVYFELLMLIFRIYDKLCEISEKVGRSN